MNRNVVGSSSDSQYDHDDIGAPLPDFRNQISIQTVAPALGVFQPQPQHAQQPDYLEYDVKGRGVQVNMFANAGVSYLFGIAMGGSYGLYHGIQSTPNTRFRVQLNSVLNHSGRYGSKMGNTAGVFAVFYSIYEGIADRFEFDRQLGLQYTSYPMLSSFVAPGFGATATCMTYFAPNGIRVAALAGALGLGSVATTYGIYHLLGIPYGYRGYLFF